MFAKNYFSINASPHSESIASSLSSEDSACNLFSTIRTSMYNLAAIWNEGIMSAQYFTTPVRITFHAYLDLSVSLANRKDPEPLTAERRST
jgi:hypothetical protein